LLTDSAFAGTGAPSGCHTDNLFAQVMGLTLSNNGVFESYKALHLTAKNAAPIVAMLLPSGELGR